jgi:hypothetical protein
MYNLKEEVTAVESKSQLNMDAPEHMPQHTTFRKRANSKNTVNQFLFGDKNEE